MDYDRVVHLMILEDKEKKHYVAMKSLERLLSKMNSKHNPAQHFCNNCLQGFFDHLEIITMNTVDLTNQ